MIAEIIDLLRKGEFYGAGEYTEIAKGKHEMITNFSVFKNKIKRKWQSRKL
jgi:DNA invertase Pin-like site-specific DNA recombinase